MAEALVRGTRGRNVFGPPKSKAGTRTMFMPKVIVDMLSAHLDHAGFTHDDTDALVFTDEEGGPLRYSNWRRRVWLPAAAAAGCAGAGFHDLRRLNATTLVVEGIDVKTAQTRLGHADPRTTLAVYASAPASIDRAAADVIGERFFGEKAKKARRHEISAPSSAPIACDGSDPSDPEALTRGFESGCPDLNRGPLRPERSALTKLRHSPSVPSEGAGPELYSAP